MPMWRAMSLFGRPPATRPRTSCSRSRRGFRVAMTVGGGGNSSMVLDNDFHAFDTTYSTTATVADLSGNSLATASVAATTPPPQ
jgi:hypothetical protein